MKSLIIFLILVSTSLSVSSQLHFVRQEYCKKKEMEIITGDSIPKGYAVLLIGEFNKDEIAGTLEDLTKKQIKKMKMYCKWRHCCKVFIAFKAIQDYNSIPLHAQDENWEEMKKNQETQVSFYVLAPMLEIYLN